MIGQAHWTLEDMLQFWTPERMTAADQAGKARIRDGIKKQIRLSPGSVVGKPSAIPPRVPVDAAPEAFTTTQVSVTTQWPFRTVGKLYFTKNAQLDSASACAINNNGILTAAHVFVDPAGTGSNFFFFPALNGDIGASPYGAWTLQRWIYPNEWPTAFYDAYDYAFATTGNGGANNQLLGAALGGWLGITVNQPVAGQAWSNLGYPGVPLPGYNFNGITMWNCLGQFSEVEAPNVIAMDGNLTRGASGGPWVLPPASVNGLLASGNPQNTENYSPYFNQDVLALYNEFF